MSSSRNTRKRHTSRDPTITHKSKRKKDDMTKEQKITLEALQLRRKLLQEHYKHALVTNTIYEGCDDSDECDSEEEQQQQSFAQHLHAGEDYEEEKRKSDVYPSQANRSRRKGLVEKDLKSRGNIQKAGESAIELDMNGDCRKESSTEKRVEKATVKRHDDKKDRTVHQDETKRKDVTTGDTNEVTQKNTTTQDSKEVNQKKTVRLDQNNTLQEEITTATADEPQKKKQKLSYQIQTEPSISTTSAQAATIDEIINQKRNTNNASQERIATYTTATTDKPQNKKKQILSQESMALLHKNKHSPTKTVGIEEIFHRDPHIVFTDPVWNSCMSFLTKFKDKYGHCKLSTRKAEFPILAAFAEIVKKERTGTGLSKERIKALNDIGFEWDSLSDGKENVHAKKSKNQDSITVQEEKKLRVEEKSNSSTVEVQAVTANESTTEEFTEIFENDSLVQEEDTVSMEEDPTNALRKSSTRTLSCEKDHDENTVQMNPKEVCLDFGQEEISRVKRQEDVIAEEPKMSSEDEIAKKKAQDSTANDNDDNFWSDYKCGICQGILSDPYLLPNCCHRFCGRCILGSVENGIVYESCPTCNAVIGPREKIKRDDMIGEMLIGLQKLEAVTKEMNGNLSLGNFIDADNIPMQETKEYDFEFNTNTPTITSDNNEEEQEIPTLTTFSNDKGNTKIKTTTSDKSNEEDGKIPSTDSIGNIEVDETSVGIFSNNDDGNLECGICQLVLSDPHVLPNCCHFFCGKCIFGFIEDRGSINALCPTCNVSIGPKENIHKDEMMQNMLSEIQNLEEEVDEMNHSTAEKEESMQQIEDDASMSAAKKETQLEMENHASMREMRYTSFEISDGHEVESNTEADATFNLDTLGQEDKKIPAITNGDDVDDNFWDEFECTICHETLSDPHILPNCCHRFCGKCILSSSEDEDGNEACPTCNVAIGPKENIHKDEMMQNMLAELQQLEEKAGEIHTNAEKEESIQQIEDNVSSTEPTNDPFEISDGHEVESNTEADATFNLDTLGQEDKTIQAISNCDEDDKFWDEFECTICHETLSDPHILPNCGHRFCGKCILQSNKNRNENETCPTCNVAIGPKENIKRDEVMKEMLVELQQLEEQEVSYEEMGDR
ncbi:hypothetical protein CTEN210_00316 [Chaetoceros tenuissimus]|uniref:RING-type domain-containing protein n=1 Tax=Chaetoceros tenuissimus TaxID=426638 RepID=A0AAD3CDZ4_9STRA|nr:hypothetical protein CTEN210_00316 [Chaetoceros tenuissimus]